MKNFQESENCESRFIGLIFSKNYFSPLDEIFGNRCPSIYFLHFHKCAAISRRLCTSQKYIHEIAYLNLELAFFMLLSALPWLLCSRLHQWWVLWCSISFLRVIWNRFSGFAHAAWAMPAARVVGVEFKLTFHYENRHWFRLHRFPSTFGQKPV